MTVFRDNVVIVTGASMGLSPELAVQLVGLAWLALAARSGDRLAHTAEERRKRGGGFIAVRADVTQTVPCKPLVGTAVGRYGRIDTLIENAGTR
ncbi:MAG: SDR family NAD(P)-dependent oxidoreductase [Gammaproteobacteria bacterium]|nr:SDR family NAD(P)-dependent oxidoreductase [Gammaproteobacteria bacterium]